MRNVKHKPTLICNLAEQSLDQRKTFSLLLTEL